MRAAAALNRAFAPRKMNLSCYGNAEPHVHWHLVPRYEDDPHPGQDPWRDAERFSEKTISPAEAATLAAQIRSHLG